MATQPTYPLLSAEDFLDIDFRERKAELDNGVIRMMAGGTRRHAQVGLNVAAALRTALRGSGCSPFGSDMGVRTRDLSIRYPDASVFCSRQDSENDQRLWGDDPRVIFEVLSAGTARTDLRVKLEEYRELPSVDTIVFVDIATERLRVVQRTGPAGWNDVLHAEPFDVPLPALGIGLPHAEIFARD